MRGMLLAAGLIIYIILSYAYFYGFIKLKHLPNPNQGTYTLGKDKKVLKMVSLGDSLTAGVGVSSPENSYPYLLAEKLSKNSSITLLNLAAPGATIKDVINDQLPQAKESRPDLVTILVGINDIHNFKSLNSFKEDYSYLIEQLSETKAKIILINLPYLGANTLLLPPYSFLSDLRTRQFNQIILDLAKERHLVYIDLYKSTKSKFQEDPTLYSSDLFHPSSLGYKIIAQEIDANWNK